MMLRALSFTPFVFVFLVLTAPDAIAQDSTRSERSQGSTLDPRRFVTLRWNDRPIAEPGKAPWEVIGQRGTLNISLDLEAMKREWEIDTAGNLTMRGHIRNVTGGERSVEIPGYSMVGSEETTIDLDMNSARALVDQLIQGSQFAHRILDYQNEARLASTLAEINVYNDSIRQYLDYLDASEAELLDIYSYSLDFALTYDKITRAGLALQAAEERLGNIDEDLAAARALEATVFFKLLESDVAAMRAYIAALNATANRPYMEILGGMIGKGANIIRSTTSEIAKSLPSLDGSTFPETPEQRQARLVHIAELLVGLERDKYYEYRNAGEGRIAKLTAAPQFKRHMPTGEGGGKFDIRTLEYVPDSLRGAELNVSNYETSCRERLPLITAAVPDTIVDDYMTQRIDRIRIMVERIAGSTRYPRVNADIERKFERQLKRLTDQPKKYEAALKELSKRFERDCAVWEARKALREDPEVAKRIERNAHALRVLLMIDAIGALIDRIVPTNVSLDELALKQGDQLAVSVSFIRRPDDGAAPPPQLTYTFEARPWGFSGVMPTVRDTLYVVKPDKKDNFAVAPAVVAAWNFYGGGSKVKTFWRTLAPGFGFTTTFLNFDQDDTTIEFGIGPSFTAFNNILHVSFGWNLSAQATRDGVASRRYVAIGVSLTEVVQRLQPGEQ